ncbi:uncharacterized protein LOC144715091 [Wolffia australiana]
MLSPTVILSSDYSEAAPPPSSCLQRRRLRRQAIRAAAGRGDYFGRLADEDMINLRRRIREMEVAEMGEKAAPPGWPEWERRYYRRRYAADVSDAVAALQRLLLSSRPAAAFAAVAVVAVSVPTAAALLVYGLAAAVCRGAHLG